MNKLTVKSVTDTRTRVAPWPTSDGASERYPAIEDPVAFVAYFKREGFIVLRNAVPKQLCEAAKQAFLTEVKLNRSFFIRHASSVLERHVFTEAGFMQYPIMNIQDVSSKRFPFFKQRGLDLLTQPSIQRAAAMILGETVKLAHTMYFDGNQTTWAHRDCRYIDAEQSGKMVAVWVAAEDIHEGAGRFFICPRSPITNVPGEQDGECADPNGSAYKALMADFVAHGPLECVAPVLKQGDALLWSAMTIHGSLATTAPNHSRRSFTGHYVPLAQKIRHVGNKGLPSQSIVVNGVQVVCYGDQHTYAKQARATVREFKHTLKAKYPGLVSVANVIRRKSG